MAIHALIHILAWQICEGITHVLHDDFLLREHFGLICGRVCWIKEQRESSDHIDDLLDQGFVLVTA